MKKIVLLINQKKKTFCVDEEKKNVVITLHCFVDFGTLKTVSIGISFYTKFDGTSFMIIFDAI